MFPRCDLRAGPRHIGLAHPPAAKVALRTSIAFSDLVVDVDPRCVGNLPIAALRKSSPASNPW